MRDLQLKDKVCLIVGASGAIGGAIAKRFRAELARTVETDFSSSDPCQDLDEGSGEQCRLRMRLDVRQWLQVREAVQKVIEQFGRIDVLINCAGVLGPIGPTRDASIEDWLHAVQVNLVGAFYLTRAVLGFMEERGGGKIIHFSGGGAAYGRPFFTAYSASKAGLVRFVESLAEEVRGKNIQVNAIAPGPVNSRMWEQLRNAGELGGQAALREIKSMDETGGVSPDRAVSLALFLASDRSNGLTGRLISAVHDPWETLEQRIPSIMVTEAGTLRRVPVE